MIAKIEWTGPAPQWIVKEMRDEIERQDAEIKRLREALLKIAGSMIGTGQNSRVLVEIAKEALGE